MRQRSALHFASLVVWVALAAALASCSGGTRQGPAASPTDVAPASGAVPVARVDRDVTYCSGGGEALKMDLYFPGPDAHRPAPAAMYVHGGGFTAGDKSTGAGYVDVAPLVGRGYVVAAVNYRLAPEHPFPAAIEDVKCAVRYLRANAASLGIDPTHIGAWGGSAGGSLVALLGVTDADAGLEGSGGYAGVSSRVQAVVDYFGPTDIRSPGARPLLGGYIPDGAGGDALAVRASAVTWVTPDDPPFLILHGERDAVVPLNQSQALYERLRSAGVPVEYIVVRNAAHGFVPSGGAIDPSRDEISRMVGDFFDRYLKPK